MADNIARVFADAIAPDLTRPLLTWYDDATGERTELSGATLANWGAKTANLLTDEVGAAPGDAAGVLLPPHWQTAAVLLGCWSAKLTVVDSPGPVEALFVAVDRVDEAAGWPAGERYALALDPFALPMRQVPAGYADFVTAVRGHGDHFTPDPAAGARCRSRACTRRRPTGGRAISSGAASCSTSPRGARCPSLRSRRSRGS